VNKQFRDMQLKSGTICLKMAERIAAMITALGDCLGTATTIDNVARANEIIQSNPRVTIDEIAETIGISFGSAHEIITERLEYRSLCQVGATITGR